MRVIAGKFKGKRLLCPPGLAVRPTSDAAKETIFNLLGDRVCGARVLDLFAGVGALGIEALSRGAGEALFVEREARAVKYTLRNLRNAGAREEAVVLRGDVFASVERLSKEGRRYSLVFLDPPYGRGLVSGFTTLESVHPIVQRGGCLVIQHHAKEPVDENAPRHVLEVTRKMGDTLISLFVCA